VRLTLTQLKKIIQEELAKITEGMPPGLGDAPGDPEPDYSGEPEMSRDEEAAVAADQMIAAFEEGNFDISLDDALIAIGAALKQRAVRSRRLEEKTEE